MISSTISGAPTNTDEQINARVREETHQRVVYYAAQGEKAIERRLAELNEEWDIQRAVQAMASSFTLVSVTLGILGKRRFLLFPALIAGLLLQYAIQGWCPPVPVLRRLGFRTAEEIAAERYALKALRGDFRQVTPQPENEPASSRANEALLAARR